MYFMRSPFFCFFYLVAASIYIYANSTHLRAQKAKADTGIRCSDISKDFSYGGIEKHQAYLSMKV